MSGLRGRQKAQREARILDAALSIFRARGFEAARMDQIAEMAELSTGTLYNYFPAKGDLLVAIVVLETQDTLAAGVDIVQSPPDDPTDALMALADVWYAFSMRLLDKKLWRHAFAMMIERPDAASSMRFSTNDQSLRDQIAELVGVLQRRHCAKPEIEPENVAVAVFNMIDRTFMSFVADDAMEPAQLHDALKRQLQLVGDALKP